jgi:hypothetical protein
MKPATLTALLGLTFVVLLSSVYAQQKTPGVQLSKDYLDVLGARLRLGMPEADVAEKVVGAEVVQKTDDQWFFKDGTTIQFKNGMLNFADREWVSGNNTPVDALFGLVNSLNSEGYTQCSVSADTVSDPVGITQRVWLHCGNKSVLVLKSRFGDKSFEDVYEQLGSLESRPK